MDTTDGIGVCCAPVRKVFCNSAMTKYAIFLKYAAVLLRNRDRLVKILQSKRLGVVEAVLSFRDVLVCRALR